MASASLAEQVDNVLGLAESWNQTHLAEVLTFLDHKGDKFHMSDVRHIARSAPDFAALAAGFGQRNAAALSQVPADLHASLVSALRMHQLEAIFKAVSAPQLLALHRGIPEGASKEQIFQQLVQLQKVLVAQPLTNLRSVHQMYRDEGPDSDKSELARMMGIGADNFFVVEPVRQVLSLDADQLKALRESLSLFSAAHLNLLVELMVLESYKVLDMRMLFVPLILEEPENFLGGGFALGLSGGELSTKPMDEDEDEEDEYGEEWQSAVRVEIVEQPPKGCVYRRNVRPSPEVIIKGSDGGNSRLRVGVVVLRTDTMEELDEATSLSGDVEYKVASGTRVVFKKLKIMQTSNQLGDTHVALRFELREYKSGSSDDYQVVHSAQSTPFLVMSHSTQLKKPKEVTPVVADVIPSQGFKGGGTRLVILGEHFMDTPTLRVRFDRVDVQPVYHGPGTLVCVAPPAAGASSEASIRVCNDVRKWGNPGSVPFRYVEEPDPVYRDPSAPMPALGGRGGGSGEFFDLNDDSALATQRWRTESGTDLSFMLTSSFDYPPSLNSSFNFGADLSSSK